MASREAIRQRKALAAKLASIGTEISSADAALRDTYAKMMGLKEEIEATIGQM